MKRIAPMYLLIFCCVLSHSIVAETLHFFAVGTPQFDQVLTPQSHRAYQTMVDTARLVSNCTNCNKILPIAGNLTFDHRGMARYATTQRKTQEHGVKVLDGLGERDTHLMPVNSIAFGSEQVLRQGEGLADNGWAVVDTFRSKMVDSGNKPCGIFVGGKAHYCDYSIALFYTVALASPGSTVPSAYMIQLHNGMFTEPAVRYLKRFKHLAQRNPNLPIILVGHALDGNEKMAFQRLIRQLPVALILTGSQIDEQKKSDTGLRMLEETISTHLLNASGSPIPSINLSAAFHNILWSFSLDTHAKAVSFRRYNRVYLGNIEQIPTTHYHGMTRHINESLANHPVMRKKRGPSKCNYWEGKHLCLTQAHNGEILPGRYR